MGVRLFTWLLGVAMIQQYMRFFWRPGLTQMRKIMTGTHHFMSWRDSIVIWVVNPLHWRESWSMPGRM